MSGATAPSGGEEAKYGRSSFDIALGMFRKRKMAVVAAGVLGLFFAAAIWAPLLANHLPLRFRGFDRLTATTAWRVANLEARALSRALAGEEKRTPEQIDASFGVIEDRLAALGSALPAPRDAAAEGIRAQVAAARAAWGRKAGPDAAVAAALKAAATAIKETLKPGEAETLKVRTSWPALAALDGLDVGFMVLSVSLLFSMYWMRSRPGRPRRPRVAAVVAFVPALLAGCGWSLLVDRFDDPTDYYAGLKTGTMVGEATFAPVPFGLNQNDLDHLHEPPGDDHLLGTDESGRDLLCRLLWGSRVSLSVGFVAVGIYILIGIVIGAVAGYFRGWTDILVSRFIEWVICFPVFFLILVIVAFLKDRTIFGMEPPQLVVIMAVIGVTGWTNVARLVRAEFLRLGGQDFVIAARALGSPVRRIIFRHVLPNAMAPVLVSATFGVAGAILTESSLSFLGLGITVPKPSWGGMLFTAHGYEQISKWMFLWPGLAIFLVITCYNLVGEALRDALDPRLRQ